MPRFVCWEKEEGDPLNAPHHRQVVDEYDAEGAAEVYAERYYEDTAEPFDSLVIMVRNEFGVAVEVAVAMEFSPTFTGTVVS